MLRVNGNGPLPCGTACEQLPETYYVRDRFTTARVPIALSYQGQPLRLLNRHP